MPVFLLRLATSRTGIVLLLCAALFTWHKLDKSSAIRRAVVQYVAGQELGAAQAELDEMKRRAVAATVANEALAEKVAAAEGAAQLAVAEIDEWEREHERNPEGLVDDALFDRLHGH